MRSTKWLLIAALILTTVAACGDQHIWSKGEAWLTYGSTDYQKRQS